jgi:lipoprotein-releasing system permease protein
MNLTNSIAIRYLFGRKSSQAIHWITGISVLGISVGSAALILVLSVFNGFEELLSGLFSKYNPDIKIVLKEGKTFREDSLQMQSLHKLNGVLYVTRTLEEVAMFQYDDAHEFGIIKGVDSEFEKVCAARDAVVEGKFEITGDGAPLANLGLGIKNKLGVSISNFQEVIKVFVPDHEENLNFTNEIKRYPLQPQSVFSFHQDGDYSNIITDLNAVQIILKKPNQLSSIELKLNPGTSVQNILPEIRRIMGDSYLVKDRYQQDEAFLKIMKLEKWLFYSLFCLTLLLVSFTVVGALWMIVLEKRMDISILKSMGMTDRNMKMVFVHLGLMICFLGLMFGSALALTFYWLQKKYGLIGVPEEFIIDSYPIQIRLADFLVVGLTVLLIGCIASFLPTRKVAEILPVFHEE